MSLDFKLHYDRLREGDPTTPKAPATNEKDTFYDGPSYARNLCLIWPDGKRQFLNYAYLVAGNFLPGDNINLIKLNFSTHIVTMKGYKLETLFDALISYLPKQIVQVENRYVQASEEFMGIVTEITVEDSA